MLTIYALLLVRVQRLAHFPRPSRFLTTGAAAVQSAVMPATPTATPTATPAATPAEGSRL